MSRSHSTDEESSGYELSRSQKAKTLDNVNCTDEESSEYQLSLPCGSEAKKRRLSTAYTKCIICQSDRGDETLRKAKQSSVSRLIFALKSRKDEVYKRLLPEIDNFQQQEILWHSVCYSVYTSQHNISHSKTASSNTESHMLVKSLSLDEEKSIPKITTRSVVSPHDWSTCLFCKCKTHKKLKEMHNVCTFDACKTIYSAAEVKGDEQMLHIIRSVNHDLVAAEAKYHKNCFSAYVSKTNLKYSGFREKERESAYDQAFEELVEDIKDSIEQGKAFDMGTLLFKYKGFLENRKICADSYTKQKLKLRLHHFFGDSIVFHQPFDKSKSELVYSSKISLQDVINAAVSQHQNTAEFPITSSNVSCQIDETQQILKVAKILKAEIKDCKSVSTQPFDINSNTTESLRSLIPKKLYSLLQWIITSDGTEDVSLADSCKNEADERKVLSIAQDIIHCTSHARIKMPKHVSLAMTVRHLTASKQLITLLNRMGHCSSYEEIERIDTCIAEEVLAKSKDFGTVIPSNISPGSFIQLAADNNDINEETLDGKNTTHATTMVVFQRKALEQEQRPISRTRNDTTMSLKRRSLKINENCYELQDFYAQGKRPSVKAYVGKTSEDWQPNNDDEYKSTCNMDFAWRLVRLDPLNLNEVFPLDSRRCNQAIPSWSGFNCILFPDLPRSTDIGYCPMINGSSSEFSTIYTVMKHAQMITKSVGQTDTVISFDLAIYIKAKQIQWWSPDEFADTVIRTGGFHIALNFLSLLGKKYANSGLEDLLIESGVYGSGSTSSLMKGQSYNRGVRAHKLTMESLYRLMWNSFIQWKQSKHQTANEGDQDEEEAILEKIKLCKLAVERKTDVQISFQNLKSSLQNVMSMFEAFKKEASEMSKLFAFWSEYCSMVDILLQFIKAERTGNWPLHLTVTAKMVPYFYAMDRQNYARWLPVYLADMQDLASKHPQVHKEFILGNHAVSRSKNAFSQVWTDMALEQSINLDSKSKGGIIGITQKPGALERWFLTGHERAAIVTSLKKMYAIQDCDRIGTHKESAVKRINRDEVDVQKIISCVETGLVTHPFSQDSESLINIATGVVLPSEIAESLIQSTEKGRKQMNIFVQKRLCTNEVSFWNPIPKLKIKTFTTTTKKVQIRGAAEKMVTISGDRDIFGRLLIAAQARKVDLKELLRYELSPVPFALAHTDGSLRKTNKSALLSIMEKCASTVPRLPVITNNSSSVLIIDGMALIQSLKTGGANKFGDMADKYFSSITKPLQQNNCDRVDVVFDQYWDSSIKAVERERRGATTALQVKIGGSSTPIPKQWGKFIANTKNKVNVRVFLTQSFCELGKKKLPQNKQLVDGEDAVLIKKDHLEIVNQLACNHEEADTRLVLHAKHAAQSTERVVIQSPDTDVLVLCVAHYRDIGCRELWFRTGVKDRLRFIPVHDICQKLGHTMCKALLAFHAITGCDSNSSIAGIGKKKAWEVLQRSEVHQENLAQFGECAELDDTGTANCEAFICSLYNLPSKRTAQTVDEMRYLLFCQKKPKSENLPPTSDSLKNHLKRASYQTFIWRKSLVAIPEVPSPDGHGWSIQEETLNPVLMSQEPAPKSILELTTCSCMKSECKRNCSCQINGLPCIEACHCMGGEECSNSVDCLPDDESDSDSDED